MSELFGLWLYGVIGVAVFSAGWWIINVLRGMFGENSEWRIERNYVRQFGHHSDYWHTVRGKERPEKD